MSVHHVPTDAWFAIADHLAQRDVVSLGMTSRHFRDMMRDILTFKGVSLRLRDQHVAARYPGARSLTIVGRAARCWNDPPPLALSLPRAMPFLERLAIGRARLPAGPFWKTVFETCPMLQHVSLMTNFDVTNYATDVQHHMDLHTIGAPRLKSLDTEGGWMILYPPPVEPHPQPAIDAAFAAIRRVNAMEAVPSSTLRTYRVACRQAPVGVDAPLDFLDIEERFDPPYIVSRMGPLTLRTTKRLRWKTYWPTVDASLLAGYIGLDTLDLVIEAAHTAWRLSKCLRTLDALPRSLKNVSLTVEAYSGLVMWDDVKWGTPLAHLSLDSLKIRMTSPHTIHELLTSWMGATAKRIFIEFDEPESAGWDRLLHKLLVEDLAHVEDESVLAAQYRRDRSVEPIDPSGLDAWLEAHPDSMVTIRGLGGRLRTAHPRCTCA